MIYSIKTSLSGEGDVEPSADVIAQIANEVYAQDLLSLMVVNMAKLEFEVSTIWLVRTAPSSTERELSVQEAECATGSEGYLQHIQHLAS